MCLLHFTWSALSGAHLVDFMSMLDLAHFAEKPRKAHWIRHFEWMLIDMHWNPCIQQNLWEDKQAAAPLEWGRIHCWKAPHHHQWHPLVMEYALWMTVRLRQPVEGHSGLNPWRLWGHCGQGPSSCMAVLVSLEVASIYSIHFKPKLAEKTSSTLALSLSVFTQQLVAFLLYQYFRIVSVAIAGIATHSCESPHHQESIADVIDTNIDTVEPQPQAEPQPVPL